MEQLNKAILIGVLFLIPACGVKGRPLPPLNPAPLGRGEPTFKEAQKKPAKKIIDQEKESEELAPHDSEEP